MRAQDEATSIFNTDSIIYTFRSPLNRSSCNLIRLTQDKVEFWFKFCNFAVSFSAYCLAFYFEFNRNYNKILESNWSAALIRAFITYRAKLLNAKWLRQRAFFLNHDDKGALLVIKRRHDYLMLIGWARLSTTPSMQIMLSTYLYKNFFNTNCWHCGTILPFSRTYREPFTLFPDRGVTPGALFLALQRSPGALFLALQHFPVSHSTLLPKLNMYN